MPSNESPLKLVRGPTRKPGWAQLIRLGGDGAAILFGELRKSVGRIDGVVERLLRIHNLSGTVRDGIRAGTGIPAVPVEGPAPGTFAFE